MITALVALGPNDVAQPCVFFESVERGLSYVREHIPDCRVRPRERFGQEGFDITDEDGDLASVIEGAQEDDNNSVAKAFWTRYYGGCGEVGLLFLAKFPYATPFLPWDLD